MKKLFILLLTLTAVCLMPVSVFAKSSSKVNIELKMDYKNNAANSSSERIMKNDIQFDKTNKWIVAGKAMSEKNNNITMLMVRLLRHNNNKCTIQFMLIDSGIRDNFIIEPQLTVLAGLPAKLAVHKNNRDVEFSVLAVINPQ